MAKLSELRDHKALASEYTQGEIGIECFCNFVRMGLPARTANFSFARTYFLIKSRLN